MWCKGFAIVVEIDEDAHRGAAYSCDFRRMAEMVAALGSPIFFIRYKPNAPDSDLQTLAQTITDISNRSPEWEFLGFSVTYLFYNEQDAQRAAKRQHIAGYC